MGKQPDFDQRYAEFAGHFYESWLDMAREGIESETIRSASTIVAPERDVTPPRPEPRAWDLLSDGQQKLLNRLYHCPRFPTFTVQEKALLEQDMAVYEGRMIHITNRGQVVIQGEL